MGVEVDAGERVDVWRWSGEHYGNFTGFSIWKFMDYLYWLHNYFFIVIFEHHGFIWFVALK